MADQALNPAGAAFEGSVVDKILETFLAKIASEPELAEAATRLRKTLLEDREDGEAALKNALFGGDVK